MSLWTVFAGAIVLIFIAAAFLQFFILGFGLILAIAAIGGILFWAWSIAKASSD